MNEIVETLKTHSMQLRDQIKRIDLRRENLAEANTILLQLEALQRIKQLSESDQTSTLMSELLSAFSEDYRISLDYFKDTMNSIFNNIRRILSPDPGSSNMKKSRNQKK